MDKTTKAKIVEQIMTLDAWADIEELTFPLDNPTDKAQNEWFDTFVEHLEQRIRDVLDDEFPEQQEGER